MHFHHLNHPVGIISPKWYSVAPIDLIWKTIITVLSFLGHLTGKQLVLSLKLLKNTTEKGQNQANPEQALFRANFSYKLPSKA